MKTIGNYWKPTFFIFSFEKQEDIADEIFTLIGSIFYELAPELQLEFLEHSRSSLKAVASKNKAERETAIHQTSLLLETLATRNPDRKVPYLAEEPLSAIITLSWTLFEDECFMRLKNATKIEDLLAACFRTNVGVDQLTGFIRRCTESLASDSIDNQRSIRCLGFLLDKLNSNYKVVLILHEERVAEVIEKELVEFLSKFRPLLQSGSIDATEYTKAIKSRLRLFRTLYGSSPDIWLEDSLLLRLSKLPVLPCERNEFFHFYREIISRSSVLNPAINMDSALNLFQNVICDPNLDWSNSPRSCFDTFKAYLDYLKLFHGVRNGPQVKDMSAPVSYGRNSSIVTNSVPTLWKIALAAEDPEVRLIYSFAHYDSFAKV